mgnify:CR=1 FL=1
MRKRRISYFRYAFILAVLLSLLTLVVSFLSPIFDRRLVYRFFYYSSMNFVVLIGIALFANWKRTLIGERVKKHLFLIFTVIYTVIYISSSFSFLFTLQAIEYQTLFFVYQVKPLTTLLLYGILMLIGLFLISFLVSKRYEFVLLSWNKRFWPRTLFFVSLVVFLFCIYVIYSLIGVFNPIVTSYSEGNVIFIEPDIEIGEELVSQRSKLKEPNVIFVLVDSVSFDRLGSYGYPRDVSPNLDFLASKGLVFNNAYSTATHSDYAQPGYLSSRYMLVNDYRNFFEGKYKRVFVWDIFKKMNYTTGYISSQDDLWAGMNEYYDFSNLDLYWHSLTDGKTDYGTGLSKKYYDHKTMYMFLKWFD